MTLQMDIVSLISVICETSFTNYILYNVNHKACTVCCYCHNNGDTYKNFDFTKYNVFISEACAKFAVIWDNRK